jgi:electron transfer flavoprotein alpha subunit
MATLLIADHGNGFPTDLTCRALTAALAIGAPVDVLVAGDQAQAAAVAVSRLAGVRRVLLAEASYLSQGMAEAMAAQVVALADGYAVLVAPASSSGKSVMPRVAALLDVAQVSEVIEILAPDTFRRPIYAGNAIQTVRATDPRIVLTVRGAAFAATADHADDPALIEPVDVVADPALARFVQAMTASTDRPELTSARVILSGGRALGSADSFNAVLLPVADRLGAAIGASRAAVDSGFAPNDWQVGQTGKVVAPDLYIACGISGAIQHLAGMKDSKVIVAINTDPEAPIFEVADYGLVADLFTALPELERQL